MAFLEKIGFMKPKEEETATEKVSSTAQKIAVNTNASPAVQNIINNTFMQNPVGTVDQKFIDHLSTKFSEANLPGTDFFEFVQAIDNLKTLGLTEEKTYQTAWATFSAMGGSNVESLINNASYYISELTKDKDNFNGEVEKALSEDVGSISSNIESLNISNQQAAEKILQLQETIRQNNETIAKANQEIGDKTTKLKTAQSSYNATFEVFIKKIQDTANNIKTYIK